MRSACLARAVPARNRVRALEYSHLGQHPFVCRIHTDLGAKVLSIVQQLPALDLEAKDWDAERSLTIDQVVPDLSTHCAPHSAEALATNHNLARCVALQ